MSVIVAGSKVRITVPEYKTPEFGWGDATPDSVGVVRHVEQDGSLVIVDFPEHAYWAGLPIELELVQDESLSKSVEQTDDKGEYHYSYSVVNKTSGESYMEGLHSREDARYWKRHAEDNVSEKHVIVRKQYRLVEEKIIR